jgi:hypothetical protein
VIIIRERQDVARDGQDTNYINKAYLSLVRLSAFSLIRTLRHEGLRPIETNLMYLTICRFQSSVRLAVEFTLDGHPMLIRHQVVFRSR